MDHPHDVAEARTRDDAATKIASQARAQLIQVWQAHAVTDPNSPLYVAGDGPHWHVRRHDEDDDEAVVDTVFAALSYADEHLERIGDFERDGADDAAKMREFEEAWQAHQRARTAYNLADGAQAVHKHANLPPWLRAPAYAGDDEAENTARLKQAARNAVEKINSEGPSGFYIRECPIAECALSEDDGDDHDA